MTHIREVVREVMEELGFQWNEARAKFDRAYEISTNLDDWFMLTCTSCHRDFEPDAGTPLQCADCRTATEDRPKRTEAIVAQPEAVLDPFLLLCAVKGLPVPVVEHRFHVRRWRFDYAWPDRKLALEVEGGVWSKGRHNRPKGFLGDMQKYNEAALHGWLLLRTTPGNLCKDETVAMLERALEQREAA